VCILLTGATGFLGNSILLDIKSRVEAGEISNVKLFLPIRSKNRINGETRCEELTRELGLSVHGITVIWIDPIKGTNSWPREINSVLLCAFDTNFNRPLNEMFLNSVYPIIETLRAISKDTSKTSDNRWPHLKKIVLVSTAFVQPPLPFLRRSSGNIKEWAPIEVWNNDPVFLYNNLMELASKNEDITSVPTNMFMEKLPKLHEHTRVNTYIFCKTFVEAMIEYDRELRGLGKIITVVRPSIIGASMDGTQYSIKSPGCSSMLVASNQLIGRGVKWTGSIDVVPICKVAHVIVDASRISDSNPDFKNLKEQNNYIRQGTVESKYSQIAEIQYITNGFSFSTVVLNASCGKWFSIAFPERLIPFIQILECVLASLFFFTRKAGKRLKQFYHSYDYFSSQTFDFPTVIGLDVPSHILKCTQNKFKPIDPKYCATHWMQRYYQDRDNTIMSIVAFMVFNISLVCGWCHRVQKFATDEIYLASQGLLTSPNTKRSCSQVLNKTFHRTYDDDSSERSLLSHLKQHLSASSAKGLQELAPHPTKSKWTERLVYCGWLFLAWLPIFTIGWRSYFYKDFCLLFAYLCLLPVIVLIASFRLTREFAIPFFAKNSSKQEHNKEVDSVDVVIMMPVYNEPLELILQQIQSLRNQIGGLDRVHLVIAQEDSFWEGTSNNLLETWRRKVVLESGCPRHVTFELRASESGRRAYETSELPSSKDWHNIYQQPTVPKNDIFDVYLSENEESSAQSKNTKFSSIFFSLHPSRKSPVRGACSNMHWSICRLFAKLGQDLDLVSILNLNDTNGIKKSMHPILTRNGYNLSKTMVIKLDAGVLPAHNFLQEMKKSFLEKYKAKKAAKISSKSSPYFILQPLVIEVDDNISNQFTHLCSTAISCGQIISGWAALQLIPYCCYAFPLEAIFGCKNTEPGPARGWHPDFLSDEMITGFGLSLRPVGGRTQRLSSTRFFPVSTLVWKSPPLSTNEAIRQHGRFESMFHVVIPWVLRWGGTKGFAKLWMKHNGSGSGTAVTFVLVCLVWLFDKNSLGDKTFPTSDHCLQIFLISFILPIVCWPQLQRSLTIHARNLGPIENTTIPYPESSWNIFKRSIFGIPVVPLLSFFLIHAHITSIISTIKNGWQGQTHKGRNKIPYAQVKDVSTN